MGVAHTFLWICFILCLWLIIQQNICLCKTVFKKIIVVLPSKYLSNKKKTKEKTCSQFSWCTENNLTETMTVQPTFCFVCPFHGCNISRKLHFFVSHFFCMKTFYVANHYHVIHKLEDCSSGKKLWKGNGMFILVKGKREKRKRKQSWLWRHNQGEVWHDTCHPWKMTLETQSLKTNILYDCTLIYAFPLEHNKKRKKKKTSDANQTVNWYINKLAICMLHL